MSDIDLRLVYSRRQIERAVEEMAKKIDDIYGNEPLLGVCVLKGAFIFFGDLVRRMSNTNFELDFVRLASYGQSSISSGKIIFSKDVEREIVGKHVLIVEDIVDSGHSMDFLLREFSGRGPKSLRIAALLDKAERREKNVRVDFSCFEAPDGFFVGYGLDYAEKYRSLPGIYEIRGQF